MHCLGDGRRWTTSILLSALLLLSNSAVPSQSWVTDLDRPILFGTPWLFVQPSSTAATSTTNSSSALMTRRTIRESTFGVNTSTPSTTSTITTNNATFTNIPEWKQRLPPGLQNKTKTLQKIIVPGSNGCYVEVFLLGTAHVSMDSSRDVRLLLESIQPDVIFLELCDQRVPMMLTAPPEPTTITSTTTQSESSPDTQLESKRLFPKMKRFWRRWWTTTAKTRTRRKKDPQNDNEDDNIPPEGEGGSVYGIAANLLTSMQLDYAKSLGVELGGEFRVAYNYWEESRRYQHVHLILGDRPMHISLTRAWESLGLWGKIKLLVGLIIGSLQKPSPEELREWMQKILSDDSGDLLTESIEELAQHFPTLDRVIIKERDAYMACKLYQTCQQLLNRGNPIDGGFVSPSPPKVQRIVAIVGAGHVSGMCHWMTMEKRQLPQEILAPLIEIKKGIPPEERYALIHDVLEVQYERLQALVHDGRGQ